MPYLICLTGIKLSVMSITGRLPGRTYELRPAASLIWGWWSATNSRSREARVIRAQEKYSLRCTRLYVVICTYYVHVLYMWGSSRVNIRFQLSRMATLGNVGLLLVIDQAHHACMDAILRILHKDDNWN